MITAAFVLASLTADAPNVVRLAPVEYAQLTIRERVILRIQTLRGRPPPPRTLWKEKKGPRCMATDTIGGAAVNPGDSVDFVLKGGTRLRAQLESGCQPLDYDGGFYLAPTGDGKICADRDSIHARSGGQCAIERFRTLVPAGK